MTHLIKQAEFISAPQSIGQTVPCFARALDLKGDIARATLHISALGLYEAAIDGQRVGKFLFAPGWTVMTIPLRKRPWTWAPGG